jgi:hypothetical protein
MFRRVESWPCARAHGHEDTHVPPWCIWLPSSSVHGVHAEHGHICTCSAAHVPNQVYVVGATCTACMDHGLGRTWSCTMPRARTFKELGRNVQREDPDVPRSTDARGRTSIRTRGTPVCATTRARSSARAEDVQRTFRNCSVTDSERAGRDPRNVESWNGQPRRLERFAAENLSC